MLQDNHPRNPLRPGFLRKEPKRSNDEAGNDPVDNSMEKVMNIQVSRRSLMSVAAVAPFAGMSDAEDAGMEVYPWDVAQQLADDLATVLDDIDAGRWMAQVFPASVAGYPVAFINRKSAEYAPVNDLIETFYRLEADLTDATTRLEALEAKHPELCEWPLIKLPFTEWAEGYMMGAAGIDYHFEKQVETVKRCFGESPATNQAIAALDCLRLATHEQSSAEADQFNALRERQGFKRLDDEVRAASSAVGDAFESIVDHKPSSPADAAARYRFLLSYALKNPNSARTPRDDEARIALLLGQLRA